MRVDVDRLAVLEDDQRCDAGAEVVAAAMPPAAEDLSDAVAVAGVGEGAACLAVERLPLVVGDGVTVEDLVAVTAIV